jgi:hypothetical protein
MFPRRYDGVGKGAEIWPAVSPVPDAVVPCMRTAETQRRCVAFIIRKKPRF